MYVCVCWGEGGCLFYSGFVSVLKPCRGFVSFCFMRLVLCTKSENKTNYLNAEIVAGKGGRDIF